MKQPSQRAELKPAYIPSHRWRVAATTLITISCLLIVGPLLINTARTLDTSYPLQDFYIIVRELLVATGFAAFHLAAYYCLIFRKIKRSVITVAIGYAFITLGVIFGWLVFQPS